MSVNLKDFDSLVASFAQDAAPGLYRNGYAIYLYTSAKKEGGMFSANKKDGLKSAVSVLDEAFKKDVNYVSNKKGLHTSLQKLITKIFSLKKNLTLNWPRIQDVLSQPFKVPVTRQKTFKPSDSVDFTTPGTQDGCSPPQVPQQPLETPQTIKKLRTDCSQCNSIRKSCVTRCRLLENKLREVKAKAKLLRTSTNKRVLTQTIKRRTGRVEKLKREKTSLKTTVILLERQLRISTKKTEKCSLLSRRNRVLKKKVTQEQQEVFELKAAIEATMEEKRQALSKIDELMEASKKT